MSRLLLLLILFLPIELLAHGGAHHIDKLEAEQKARLIVDKLVEKNKLAPSWKNASLQLSLKKRFRTEPEWVVSFENKTVKDPGKQTLYIFLSETGAYIAANFSGK